MTKTPKVTAIIPCYNYGRFLAKAINSVLQQTIQVCEIIIVDDHSTDNTQAVVKTFDDPRIKYIRQNKNVGQSQNRNSGIEQSTGEYISLLDADDWWDPRFIETLLPAFEDEKVGAAYTYMQIFKNGNLSLKSNHQLVNGYAYEELFVSNFIGTAVMFKSEVIKNIGYKTDLSPKLNNMGVDWWVLLELSTQYKIVGFDSPYYTACIHNTQISTNYLKRIQADRIIQQTFLEKYPNLISKRTIREAMGWRYHCEGLQLRESGHKIKAILAYFRSITINPLRGITYKALLYTLLKR